MISVAEPEAEVNIVAGKKLWGLSWPILYNVYGIVFSLLALYALKNIVLLLEIHVKRFQRKKVFLAVNCILCYFSFLSSLSLLLDPYQSGVYFKIQSKHQGIMFIIRGTKVPSLTASFSLITMSLLEVTKMQVYSKRLQNYRCITSIIIFHFMMGLTMDTLAAYVLKDKQLAALICQTGMVLVSVLLSIASFFAGYRVIRCHKKNVNVLCSTKRSDFSQRKDKRDVHTLAISNSGEGNSGAHEGKGKVSWFHTIFEDRSMRRIAAMTMATTVSNICYGIILICSVTIAFRRKASPDLWSWFFMNILLTFCEICMVTTMLYIVRRGSLICACACAKKH